MQTELARLAREALASSDFKAFGDTLDTQTLPDSFGVLANADLASLVAAQIEESDPTKWVTRPLTWNTQLYDPRVTFRPAERLLHLLWQDLNGRLSRKLIAVGHRTSLAPHGAVLCFFGPAQLGIVVGYTRSGGGSIGGLRPLAALRAPNGVLELTNLLSGANAEVRNAIKKAALSVDKLVYQRGAIIHVDRQREDVFGPTIDTVILGDLLAEWLNTRESGGRISVLEVGPGSGLLSVILASSDHVGELTAVDLNGSAVTCTLKNLHINGTTLDTKHQTVRIRAERFATDQFATPFDFVVCNPPYIPGDPNSTSLSMKEYGRAVGGLELCTEILMHLPTLLSADGVLLLMASSLSDRDVMALIPEGFEAFPALEGNGRRVPLDVDVVWQEPEWRSDLLADHRIEQDGDGELWHQLRPLWIRRRKGN